MSYATIPDAIQHIKATGPGCFLAKTDIKNAFWIISFRSQDQGLLGIHGKGLYNYDRCMSVGCSSSCRTFATLSSAVEWIAQKKFKIDLIIHLLDHFLIIALPKRYARASCIYFLTFAPTLAFP